MNLPESYTALEVKAALGVSDRQLKRLITDGKIGYLQSGREKRFLPEHIEEIRAAIEVKARTGAQDLTSFGTTSAAASRRRRSRSA